MLFRAIALGSVLVGALACSDASGRYREFTRRAAEVGFDGGVGGAGGECGPPPPFAIEGPALLAIETTWGPALPILFYGELQTPEADGKTQVVFDYHPLDASDRATPIGEPLHFGPYPIEADGSFSASIPEDTLPGAANPILPGVPITSTLTLSASLCGVQRFYCGSVAGRSTAPVRGDVIGRFGLTLIDRGEPLPERPRYGCGEDDVAAPLARP